MDDTKLSYWFGLSYASFAVMPRVLMEAMPKEWQNKMAVLLKEADKEFPNMPNFEYRVNRVRKGKLVKWPDWVINYRHPDYDEIRKVMGQSM